MTPKGSQHVAQERPNANTTPEGSQPVFSPFGKVYSSIVLLTALLFGACGQGSPTKITTPKEVHTASYDLIIPAEQKALLILFPCFSCDAADTG